MVRGQDDAGSVTAEAAVVLPVLLVVLAAAVWVLLCVAAQLRALDAAHLGARAAARGDGPGEASDIARRVAPTDAAVAVTRGDGLVEVVVTAQVRPFGQALRVVPAVTVRARAVAADEAEVGP
jgi:Flp pilus assembly protein TadG